MTILFTHIPKTAGTSFRYAFTEVFNNNELAFDYSAESHDTTDFVREYIYTKNDFWGLKETLAQKDVKLLSGHFKLSKYCRLFPAKKTITFVRDPLERVLSEYKHFVRNYNYKGSFEAFFHDKSFINKQSKILGDMPIPAIGVVGITERYAESLQLINTLYNLNLPMLSLNKASEQKSVDVVLCEEDRQTVLKLNNQDQVMYENSLSWFNNVLNQLAKSPGVKPLKGWIGGVHDGEVYGAAWRDDESPNQGPLKLDIFRNGQHVAQVNSGIYRQNLHILGVPRGGHVGFNFKIPNWKAADVIEVKEALTEFPLFRSPITIANNDQ